MSGAYEAIADKASDAKEMVSNAMPELNLYLEPISPASDLSFKDRAQLIVQSARPWPEFFDVTQFNLPPLSELSLRVATNIESFTYNYLMLGIAYLILFSFGHFPSVLALLAVLGLSFFLYVLHPEPIEIGNAEFGAPAKHTLTAVAAILALTVGHVTTLIVSLAVFLLIVVGIHASIREHTA
jgi:hypothetical protein